MAHIHTRSLRKAFTLLELIFVVVILGIVSSIGAQIIANIYENYIIQRAQHRASLKTEIAATQIANRLAYAIPGTVVRKSTLADGTPTDINEPGVATDTILQWVGADVDSFKAITSNSDRLPGWSGFSDVNNSILTGTVLSTPGSNLNLADSIIGNLGGDLDNAAIFYEANATLQRRDIATSTGANITLDTPLVNVSEHYKLAWTSYALVADGNLTLHYNFTPTVGVDATNASSELLLRNVSTFEFRGDGRTIRFKICVDEPISESFDITICKEKAVF